MLDVTRLGSSTLLICISDGSQDDLCDTSWPLFSLYSNSKTVEEGDECFERIQNSVEVMLLFVSPRSCLHTPIHVN